MIQYDTTPAPTLTPYPALYVCLSVCHSVCLSCTQCLSLSFFLPNSLFTHYFPLFYFFSFLSPHITSYHITSYLSLSILTVSFSLIYFHFSVSYCFVLLVNITIKFILTSRHISIILIFIHFLTLFFILFYFIFYFFLFFRKSGVLGWKNIAWAWVGAGRYLPPLPLPLPLPLLCLSLPRTEWLKIFLNIFSDTTSFSTSHSISVFTSDIYCLPFILIVSLLLFFAHSKYFHFIILHLI